MSSGSNRALRPGQDTAATAMTAERGTERWLTYNNPARRAQSLRLSVSASAPSPQRSAPESSRDFGPNETNEKGSHRNTQAGVFPSALSAAPRRVAACCPAAACALRRASCARVRSASAASSASANASASASHTAAARATRGSASTSSKSTPPRPSRSSSAVTRASLRSRRAGVERDATRSQNAAKRKSSSGRGSYPASNATSLQRKSSPLGSAVSGVAFGSRTSAIAASTAVRYASRVAASFAQIASNFARDFRYAAEASAAETSASARASARRASSASAPAPTRTGTVACASMLCMLRCSGPVITGVVFFGSLIKSVSRSRSLAFAGSSKGSASRSSKNKHPSTSPPGSSAATLTVSLSNPLARATPREKRAEPASRSTHSTVFFFSVCVVFGLSKNSRSASAASVSRSAFVSATKKNDDAASTLILGPSERSSRAPRSAPALRVTSAIPRASRLADSESFQRATPSTPHSACAPHEHAFVSRAERASTASEAPGTEPSAFSVAIGNGADAVKVTVRSRNGADAASPGAEDRTTASRMPSFPSPPSIQRAPTSIHHHDIHPPPSGTRARRAEGARSGTQSRRFFIFLPSHSIFASGIFVISRTSETRVTVSSRNRARTRICSAAGHRPPVSGGES